MITKSRELTHVERIAIRKLVKSSCANYDNDYGCLILDCNCYMLGKCWTGGYCKYFEAAVLPLNPALSVSLSNVGIKRYCVFCGTSFQPHGKKMYCSAHCAEKAQRKQQREYMRKKRRRG